MRAITVFIADDHAVFRDGLRSLLSAQSDLRVVGDAANGRSAVRQVLACSPDIVILDIAMPQLNGIEAARQIKEAGSDAKIIILSMHSTKEHVFRALQSGVGGYLLKESAGSEVVEAIRAVHVGRRYLSRKLLDKFGGERSFIESSATGGETPLERLSPRER